MLHAHVMFFVVITQPGAGKLALWKKRCFWMTRGTQVFPPAPKHNATSGQVLVRLSAPLARAKLGTALRKEL